MSWPENKLSAPRRSGLRKKWLLLLLARHAWSVVVYAEREGFTVRRSRSTGLEEYV